MEEYLGFTGEQIAQRCVQRFSERNPGFPSVDVLAYVENNKAYVFIYDKQTRKECFRSLGRIASNPDFPDFIWYHAAVLSQKLRQEAEKEDAKERLEGRFNS